MSQDSWSEKSIESSVRHSKKIFNKRSPNWTDEEIRTLCHFVKNHKAKLFGLGEKARTKGVNAAKKKHWELAAAYIREQCSTSRHWSQVRKKWKDLTYLAKLSIKKGDSCSSRQVMSEKMVHEQEGELVHLSEMSDSSNSDSLSNQCTQSSRSSLSSSPTVTAMNQSNIKREVIAFDLDVQSCASSDVSNGQNSGDTCSSNGIEKSTEIGPVCSCLHAQNSTEASPDLNSCSENLLSRLLLQVTSANQNSSYEKARLRLEKEKIGLQRRTVKYLRDISIGLRRIGSYCARSKKRRNSNDCLLARKRQRWRCESESSV